MLPPGHEKSIEGDLPQPQAKGKRRPLQIGVHAPHCLQVRFLNHVRRIDARAHLRIETQLDERPQVGAMQAEERVEGLTIAVAHLTEQALDLR